MRTLVLLLTLVGCAREPRLQPAAGARAVAGEGVGAIDALAGVTVEVRAEAWSGVPDPLTAVLPLSVRITNGSEHPLLLRYDAMRLNGSTGMSYAVLPPYNINVTEPVPVTTASEGFYVAPHLGPYYRGARVWPDPLAWDPIYYDRYHPDFVRVELPTESMLELALPEGVLQPGGAISGFVYLQPFGGQERRVVFELDVIDAQSRESLGVVQIPFDLVGRPAS